MKYPANRRPPRRDNINKQPLLQCTESTSSCVFQPPAPTVCTPVKIGNYFILYSQQLPECLNSKDTIHNVQSERSFVLSDPVEDFFRYEYDTLYEQARTQFNIEAEKRHRLRASLLEAVLPLSFEHEIVKSANCLALSSVVEEMEKSYSSSSDVQQCEILSTSDVQNESPVSGLCVESTIEPTSTKQVCCRDGYPTFVRYGHCDSVQMLLHYYGSKNCDFQFKDGVADFVFKTVEYNYRKRRRREQC